MIGEYPSIVASENCLINQNLQEKACSQQRHIVADTKDLLQNLELESNESFEILRQKATEAMVFLCCDLDRTWAVEKVHWSPVCWFPKGYSLTTETVRKIMEKVLDECKSVGIHVPACSFDGQWHNIGVRTCTGKPLTVLQLQKDVWVEVQKMSKSSIEKELKSIKIKPQWHKVNGSLEVVSALPRLPKTPTKGWTKKPKRTNTNDKEILEEDTSLLDVLSTEVVEAGGNNAELLSCTYDHFVVEEIVNCNTDEVIWANALIDVIDQVDDLNDNENTEEHAFEMIENLCKEQTEISENTNNEETDRINLHGQDYDRILGMLQTDKNANKTKKKWDSENAETVQKMLSCENTLKIARDVDFRVVVRYLKQCKNIIIKEYATKAVKLSELTKHLSLNGEINENTHIKASRNKPKDVKPLSILAASALKSVPKNVLNISFAEYIWPDRLEQWQKNSPTDGIDVTGFEKPDFFFYVPEYSLTRHQLEVRSIDSTHLLTRTRRKTCKGGIEGFTNEPWLKVARQGKSLLTPAMVEEIVDPMSMSMANTHFSQAVQNAMQENGDFRAASLCADILDWWRAEDEAGISATERMSMRFKLRRRLLGLINFGEFPSPGQYVNGWPTQLFEALLANIDAKLLLYSLCKSGTYNSRAFSSMMGETFFSEMTHQDRAGHGVISCDEFSKYIGKTTEQLQARLDTSRTFVYRTSTKVKAYDPVSSDMNLEDLPLNDNTTESLDSDRFHIRHIKLKDHFFDSEERRRRAGTRRHGTVSTNKNALQKGSLGVRWYRARRDDSKLLPTKKLGI